MSSELITTTIVQVNTVTSKEPLNNQGFQGWLIHTESANSLEAISCETGQSLSSTANFAQCCQIGATTCTTMWTRCAGTLAVGVKTDSCGSDLFCQTVSIFQQSPINNLPVLTQIICGPSAWKASSIYRTVVDKQTTTVATTITPSSGSSPSPAQSSSFSPATNTSPATGTSSSQPSASPPSGSTSKAWIAGAVVGSVAAIAIISVLLWLLFRKRKQDKNTAPIPPVAGYPQHQGQNSGAWSPSVADSYAYGPPDGQQKVYHEVHAHYRTENPSELPAPEYQRQTSLSPNPR